MKTINNLTDNNMKTLVDQQLSEHFWLHEMVYSGTALKRGIDNVPPAAAVDNLRRLCQHVLEPLRRHFGVIRITSGYRSEQLNQAVGGVKHSQHLTGEAADIHVASRKQAQQFYDFIRTHCSFDQLLLERRLDNGCCWVHVSYREGHNRQSAQWLAQSGQMPLAM